MRATLESALYSENVAYAAIVDPAGTIIAHSDPSRVGERLPAGDDLGALAEATGVAQLRAVYRTDRMLEWRQPMLLGDIAFADIRVGLSTLLVRETLTEALGPAAFAAAVALLVAVVVAVLLAQIVVRPIHVIQQRPSAGSARAISAPRWISRATSSRSSATSSPASPASSRR